MQPGGAVVNDGGGASAVEAMSLLISKNF